MCLLLLSLHLSLGWVLDLQEAPVADELSSGKMAETGGTWKPHQGKNPWGPPDSRVPSLKALTLPHNPILPRTR